MNPSSNSTSESVRFSRREILQAFGLGAAAMAMPRDAAAAAPATPAIEGLADVAMDQHASHGWVPISERKVRIGLVGYGACRFSAIFGFQNHPNVEVVAVSDLIPDRCAALAKHVGCQKTYPSLEEMVKDDRIEAVFVATDAPSHARLCALALKHGKHAASAVPAVYGSLEDAEMLFDAVKRSGRKYMMFETSAFHQDVHTMRGLYQAGKFGELVYSEGEYIHYMPNPIASYNGWRDGSIPMWYCTHATAYHVAVTGGSFTEVSCLGMTSRLPSLLGGKNKYNNVFGTQIGMFRTSEGGMARVLVTKDTPGLGAETGRVRGTKGAYSGGRFQSVNKETEKDLPISKRPPLPPGMPAGGHGGSHGYLTNEFVSSILQDRKPLVDVAMALNLTVPGIIAAQSAIKGGELMKIPQYRL